MRRAEDYIDMIKPNEANFQHMGRTGIVNGSLKVQLEAIINIARKEAIEECAEKAEKSINPLPVKDVVKKDILQLKNEIR